MAKKKASRAYSLTKQHKKDLLDCAKILEGLLPVIDKATTGNISHTLANIHFAVKSQAEYLRHKSTTK